MKSSAPKTAGERGQHTPGPWEVVRGRHGHITGVWIACREPFRQIVGSVDDGFAITPTPTDEANARLIASAPDLLKALRDAVKDELGDDWRTRARAVIARATGAEL